MEIKTITCHNVYNAGASLQAYALMTYLDSLGHNTEIINYRPPYLTKTYSLWATHRKLRIFPLNIAYGLFMFPQKLVKNMSARKKAFDSFTKEYLHITSKTYTSNEELKQQPPIADIYFAGSDQIWNPIFENGKDPAFYLDFAPNSAIKASYAASFSCDNIPEQLKNTISKRIKNLNNVSVRESSAVILLESIGINTGVQVLDPVFLLNKSHWLSLIKDKAKPQENYLIVYDFDGNSLIKDFALKIAKEKSLKIYSFFHNDYCDKSLINSGPLDFVNYINNAQLVISNSFHATAFSIILNKNFVVIKRKENLNARMSDLLSLFKLENKMIDSTASVTSAVAPINYNIVNQKLGLQIDKSKEFINNVIEEKNNDR